MLFGSVNKVILVGNLGNDPEIRQNRDGSKIVNFSLATSESWNDKATGERKEKTEWHKVAIFNERIAKATEKYLEKGSKVYVEGQLQTRKWTDNAGQERYITEIIISSFRGDLTILDSRGANTNDDNDAEKYNENKGSSFASNNFDDDIPF